MANRNRQQQQDDRYNRYYDEDRGYGRQQEQFEQRSSSQYDNGSQAGYRNYDESRDMDRQRDWNQPRQTRQSRDYNPLDQYEAESDFRGSRQQGTHSNFRGDSYGGEPMTGPEQTVGGGSFFPQSSRYDNERSYRDRNYRNDHERGFFDKAGDEIASWFGDADAERRREMDHRGRGPSNYTRSNERILEDACDRLTEDRGVDARDVQVTVDNGEVTLDGTVNTRWEKRRAEDCVHEASGVNHVQNNLRIKQTDMRAGSTTDETIS